MGERTEALRRSKTREERPARGSQAQANPLVSARFEHRTRALPVQILTFCGSLRAASSNLALLSAVERLAPQGMTVRRYERIGELPHFTPDLDDDARLPAEARDLRDRVAEADGLLFAVPEYMHSLPGSFKNALDWMVGCPRFPGKPVALAHVSSRHAFAPGQLVEILHTMSARLVPEAGFNLDFTTNKVGVETILADTQRTETIETALLAFRKSICDRPQSEEETRKD